MSKAALNQPDPQAGREKVIEHVLEDIKARDTMGREKYGTSLMTHNGRDALWDAYQEALDLVMYLRQAILEREAPGPLTEDAAAVQAIGPGPDLHYK